MNKSFSTIFGALVATVLLGLYVATTIFFAITVYCTKNSSCSPPENKITGGMVFVLTTVSGLVSALVVSQLAITQPGENPVSSFVDDHASKGIKITASYMGGLYLFFWMGSGLVALVVGVMLYPEGNGTLSDLGTTWLGIAVAAGYSYFGIRPK